MAAATAPIKVDLATDELVTQAAHFLSRSKKDIVDAGITAALGKLNGTEAAAASLMTGLSPEEIDNLGGLPA